MNAVAPPILPPRLARACLFVQVVSGIAAMVAFYVAAFSLSALVHRHMTPWGFVYFVLLSFSAIVIHELGHLAGARLAGMTPMGFQVGSLFFAVMRRGWRIRWRKGPRRLGGFALSYPDPALPMRRQCMTMLAGGPLANLGVAVALLIALVFAGGPLMKAFLLALASAHALLGMANLVPTHRTMDSDGMALLKWRLGKAESEAGVIYARVMGRSVKGTTAESLPDDEVAFVERQPLPLSLVGLWLRLKAAQNRHEWAKAAAMSVALDHLAETMTPAEFQATRILLDITRTELAFSKAMRDRDARALDVDMPRSVRSWAPQLPPRIAALRAALAGDAVTRDRRLAEAARHARNSVDLSVEKSEAMIGAAVRSVGVGLATPEVAVATA